MTLIKCPKCGQTVLSVATTCPNCRHLLTQNPMQQGGQTDLTACRRCEKMIPRGSVTCEYCGYSVRFRRHLRRVVWSVAIVLGIAGAVVFVLLVEPTLDIGQPASPGRPTTADVFPPATNDPEGTGDTLGGLAAVQPDTRPGGVDTPLAQPTRREATPAVPDSLRPPPGATIQYVAVWGNLRTRRDTLAPVIRTIAPGTPVLVGAARNGWYAVYVDSALVGYMAGDLLTRRPPDFN